MKLPKIVIATHNPAKKERYTPLLQDIAEQIVTLDDLNITHKPEEKGQTAEENAKIKAHFYAQKTGLPVFCEDESLYVEFLPSHQQPGPYLRRLPGMTSNNENRDATDEEVINYWQNILKKIPQQKRKGYWHIAYAIAEPGKQAIIQSQNYPCNLYTPPAKNFLKGWPMSAQAGPAQYKKPYIKLTTAQKKQHEESQNKIISQIIQNLFNVRR